MSYLERIQACNRHDLSKFLPFRVEGLSVGWIRPPFAERLMRWPEIFCVSEKAVDLAPGLRSVKARSLAVQTVIHALIEEGIIDRWQGEEYPVAAGGRSDALFAMDRASASYFGIRAFGQHMNGYVREEEGLKMWIGRRAMSRAHEPGKLDQLVAGGLPHGMSFHDNLVKECREEAGISAELASQAVPVGAISYCAETNKGVKPDVLYCYDLELPADFVPRPHDGETAEFYLWPIEQVAEIVRETEEFKLNCNLVIIDFLIRSGYITPEQPDYLDLVTGLHQ